MVKIHPTRLFQPYLKIGLDLKADLTRRVTIILDNDFQSTYIMRDINSPHIAQMVRKKDNVMVRHDRKALHTWWSSAIKWSSQAELKVGGHAVAGRIERQRDHRRVPVVVGMGWWLGIAESRKTSLQSIMCQFMMGMTYTLRNYSDILLKVERIGKMTMSVPVVVMMRAIYTKNHWLLCALK